MADTTSTHILKVDDKGSLTALVNEARKLNKELEKAQVLSGKRVPGPVAAARSASTLEAGKQSSLSRSVGDNSGTGASARDFAAQAQGLGGLVRVYATFAANIFAVTAAFSALSKAADTANLIKGLDQLGASSGRNLGSLGKKLAEISDGAISVRDSLTAVAQASAGGMSNKQILQMGEVAKKASQALGRDMTDSINRLSRGITKLEPELLDELGLFTRVDKAAQEYARSVGKSTLSLSDFEKRQAFTNAVLKEGIDKFGAVDLPANPYAKISASLQNLTFNALDTVNKGLTPLLNLLASSPIALTVAVGSFATMLLKQAIPAIGHYREQLASMAKAANEDVIKSNVSRKLKAFMFSDEEILASEARVDKAGKNIVKQVDSFYATMAQKKGPILSGTAKLLPTDKEAFHNELATMSTDKLDKRIASLSKTIETNTKLSDAVIIKRKIELQQLKDLTLAVKEYQAAHAENAKIINEPPQGLLGRILSVSGAYDRLAKSASQRSNKLNILSDVSENMGSRGVLGSIVELNRQVELSRIGIDKNNKKYEEGRAAMTGFTAAQTKVVGVMQILGSATMTLVSSFNAYAMVAGIVIGAGALLLSFFSKASKEADAYSSALDEASSATKNIDSTLLAIEKRGTTKFLSVESIQARANAFQGLSDSITSVSLTFDKYIRTANWADSLGDMFAAIVGKSSFQKFKKSLADQVTSGFKVLEEGPAKQKAKQAIANLLNVKNIDLNDYTAVLKAIDVAAAGSEEKASSMAKAISSYFSKASIEVGNAADNLTSFVKGIKDTDKLVNEITNSLKDNSHEGKLGSDMLSKGTQLNEVLKDTVGGIAALKALSVDNVFLSILPPNLAQDLANTSAAIGGMSDALSTSAEVAKNTQKEYDAAFHKLEAAKAALIALKEQQQKDNKDRVHNFSAPAIETANRDIAKAKADLAKLGPQLASANLKLEKSKAEAEVYLSKFASIGDTIFTEGVKKLSFGLKIAMSEAAAIAANSYLSIIKKLGGDTSDQEYALKQASIEAQKAQLSMELSMIKTQQELNLTMQESNTLQKIANVRKDMEGDSPTMIRAALAPLQKELENYTRLKEMVPGLNKNNLEAYGKSSKPEELAIAKQFRQYLEALIAHSGKLAQLNAQSFANRVTRDDEKISSTSNKKKEKLDLQIEDNKLSQDKLAIEQGILGTYNEQFLFRQQTLESQALELSIEKERIPILVAQAEAMLAFNAAISRNDDRSAKEALDRLSFQYTKEIELEDRAAQRRKDLSNKQFLDRKKGLDEVYNYEKVLSNSRQDTSNTAENNKLDVESKLLEKYKEIGLITDLEAVKAQNYINTRRLALEYSVRERDISDKKAVIERDYAFSVEQAARQGPVSLELATALEEKRNKALTLLSEGAKRELDNYNTKVKTLEIENAKNEKLAYQADLLREIGSITDSLNTVAKGAGDAFKNIADGIVGMWTTLDKGKDKFKAIEEARKETINNLDKIPTMEEGEKQKKIDEANAKARDKYAEAEIDNYGAMAGAAKKMFGEKTAAYKAFAAVEKAMAILKIGMMLKEMAVNTSLVTSKVTGNATTSASAVSAAATESAAAAGAAAVKGGEAIVNQGTGDPYTAIPRMIAMAAFVAAILSQIGGKSIKAPNANITAEQQQKVQGTGQSYVNGKLQDNGAGVLGDPTAKNESIKKGIDKLNDNAYKNLSYSNDMLKALLAIEENTKGLAKGIYTSGLNKTIDAIKTGSAQSTALGTLIKGLTSGKTLGQATLNSILGKSKKVEVTDRGIILTGSIGQAASNNNTNLQQYQNEKTTKSTFYGLLKNTTNNTTLSAIDNPQMQQAIGGLFKGFVDVFGAAGKQFGKTGVEEFVKSLNISDNFKVSTMGLTGEEIVNAILAQVGIEMDLAAQKAFPELTKFQEIGESFSDTIIRLFNDSKTVDLSLLSVGMSLKKLSGNTEDVVAANIEMSERLVKAFGGLDAMVEATGKFTDQFLTSSQKLLPVQNSVIGELDRLQGVADKAGIKLNIAGLRSRGAFADVVRSIDVSTAAGAELYAGLLNVADGFAQVFQETRDVSQSLGSMAADGYSMIRDMRAGLFDNTTEGKIAKIQYLRGLERENIDDSAKSMYDLITNLQILQVNLDAARASADAAANTLRNALSAANNDVISAKNAVANEFKNAQSRLSSAQAAVSQASGQAAADLSRASAEAANAMIDLSNSLKSFIKEVTTGDLGVGSAEEKLKALKADFRDTLAAAKRGDQEAMKKLPEVSKNLLEAAKGQAADRMEYLKTYGEVTGEVNALSQNIDAAYGTTKRDTGSSGGDSGMASAMAELAAAQLAYDEATKNAKEAGIDTNAQEKTAIQTWRENVKKLGGIKDTLDDLGIKYDDLLLTPEDSYLQAIETYKTSTEAVKGFTEQLGMYNNTIGMLLDTMGGPLFTIGPSASKDTTATADGMKTIQPIVVPVTPAAPTSGAVNASNTTGGVTDPMDPNYWDVTHFAKGGFHTGGLRIVGENGPELESTGASRIWNADQTAAFFNQNNSSAANDELLKEMRALREEVSQLRAVNENIASETYRTAKVLTRVTRGGDSLVTSTG